MASSRRWRYLPEPGATVDAAGRNRLAATDENGTTDLSVVKAVAGAQTARMTRASPLPDDVETLKAMLLSQEVALRERDAQVFKLQETVDSQQAALASSTAEVEHLKLLIAKLRRMQFGRKAEKLDHQIEQLELRLEELEADKGAAPVEIPKAPRTAVEQAPRKPLPEHLPRDVQMHLPESAGKCSECGGQMKSLGEDVAEQLEYVPASFRVIRHVRPKFACVCCDHISQAPAPSRPIERGLAGPGLLAHVLVSKFADHVPLYPQSITYAREGVDAAAAAR
ncbi:transposase [Paraburkholderia youngii]